MNDSGTTVEQGSSSAQIISGVSGGFGLFADRAKSQALSKNLTSQAGELDQNARVEQVNAAASANLLRDRLNATLANNAAAFSTAGVDPNSGSARVIQEQNVADANRGFFEGDLNSRIRVSALKRQAAQARSDAHAVDRAGKTKMLIDFVSTAGKLMAGGA